MTTTNISTNTYKKQQPAFIPFYFAGGSAVQGPADSV